MEKHTYTKSWENNGIKVIECDTCGFKHQYPIPNEAQVSDWYKTKFGGQMKSDFIKKKKSDSDYWKIAWERRFRNYQNLLGKTKPIRILDIGCGIGDFLFFFKENGFDVTGIEPSVNFHPYLEEKGISYVPKLVDQMGQFDWDQLGQFDIVNMSMLLEHIRYPQDLVSIIAQKALRKGGILSVESPNDFNNFQTVAADHLNLNYWWIHQLHINYFDFDSLESLMKSSSLRPVYRDCQFPLEMFLLFGDNYVGDKSIGSLIHTKRVEFEKVLHQSDSENLLADLYQNFAQTGLGRAAIIYAKK